MACTSSSPHDTTSNVAASAASASPDPTVLLPGGHSAHPKPWREIDRTITNYEPLDGGEAASLALGFHNDIWFSGWNSIQHIDADGKMSVHRFAEFQWRVRDLTAVAGKIWFSLSESGKIGTIDERGHLQLIQVVPRRKFPDIGFIAVAPTGEIWFQDGGRRSLGYRSASGAVLERPILPDDGGIELTRCMGATWLASNGKRGLGTLDRRLRFQRIAMNLPPDASFGDMACDRGTTLWFVFEANNVTSLARFDPDGANKIFALPAEAGGLVAPDHKGGAYMVMDQGSRLILTHVDASGVRKAELDSLAWPSRIVCDQAGRIWLSLDFGRPAIAVTKLEPIPGKKIW